MIKVVQFDPKHLEMFTPKDVYRGEGDIVADTLRLADSPCTILYTLVHDAVVLGVVGFSGIYKGVSLVWAVLSDEISKCPKAFLKISKHLVELYANGLGIHRLQVHVRCDYKPNWKFFHALGFQCEGVMRKFGEDKSDYWLMARLF